MKLVFSEYFEYKDGNLYWKKLLSKRNPIGKIAGSTNSAGYRQVQICGKHHLQHRIIWEMFNGIIPDGLQIDHINGNKSDNRLENLRLATPSQNQANKGFNSRNSTGFKGVSFIKCRKRYQATISVNNKNINLGSFKCPTAAYIAYVKAEREIRGEFASEISV